jgi:diacylglycerol kinase family enzyme
VVGVTIRKGEAWGAPVAVPDGLTVVTSDAALHDLVDAWRAGGADLPAIGLGGGDLARTVAGGSDDQFTSGAVRLPLDLVRVEADGQTTWSTAHVVCRRSWWRGEVVLAMTAQFLGGRDVVPRAHPNDGRLDLVRVEPAMPPRARWQAARRARTGTHLPHPQLRVTQATDVELSFVRPVHVWVDGRRWRTAQVVRLTVEPDAYVAYV